jgi:hypothetical protein|tara:strand:- start:335 stop:535 length:201 start_codon:yes stop_codon:yes gene_type:complete
VETLPIPRFFQVCVGMIGMSPKDFWDLSLIEVVNSIEGFKEFNSTETESEPLDQNRLQELMELYPD